MSKKSDKVRVHFIGENADGVTGSCTLVEYKDTKILLECGMFQSNNARNDYEVNSKKFKFKPKEILYTFACHAHIDHTGNIPKLFREGSKSIVACTHETVDILPKLLKDSAFILERDCQTLSKSKRSNREYFPYYDESDVDTCCKHIRGYDYNQLYKLDERVSFMFIPSGHIIGSAQLILYIKKDNGQVVKILYTSDLGNVKFEKAFVKEVQYEHKANLVIGETTYASEKREVKKKDREKDLEKIKSVVLSTCIDKKGKVLIPSFSLDRSQFLLKILYDLFGEDEDFTIPIIIDSPLTCKLTDSYKYVLTGEDKELINKICNWKNVKFISDVDESKLCVADKSPKVILSSSGMMNAGRVLKYAKEILPDEKSTILFCGFSVEGTLAWRIKNLSDQKTISIDGKPYKNKCSVVNLLSFSGHMQYNDLLNYYKSINTECIALVHGDMNDKIKFKHVLENEYSRMDKTVRVSAVNKGTIISL